MFERKARRLILQALFACGFGQWIIAPVPLASAQSVKPAFDCAKADSDAEDAICASDNLARLDLELNRLYQLALHGPHIDKGRTEELKQTQRDWVRDRSECWKARIGLETCVANAYAFRIHELREGYADARGDDNNGISSGPVAYACEGIDALISAVFVNPDTPMVALKWLDFEMALPLVPAGSGSKYESDIWDGGTSLFWTHGDEAIFAPPGEAEHQCKQEPIG